jgi:predicted RNA-binding Zn-ribbon protein involved in translation (DUF1610 family)
MTVYIIKVGVQLFCKNCGKEIDSMAFVCPSCGVKTGSEEVRTTSESDGTTLGIIAIAGGWVIPLLGWICGGIGLSNAKKVDNSNGVALNIVGLVVSSIAFFVYLGSM